MAEIALTADGERALAEAQAYCQRTNVAIVAPEHLLAGALRVLGQAGVKGLPALESLDAAILASQGSSEDRLDANVMFGSAAREAINFTAAGVGRAGGTEINAALIAAGTIASGEVGPMFYAALGVTKEALLGRLAGKEGTGHGQE